MAASIIKQPLDGLAEARAINQYLFVRLGYVAVAKVYNLESLFKAGRAELKLTAWPAGQQIEWQPRARL